MRPNRAFIARAACALAFAASLALIGCVEDERTAGVDEFPNSIYARVNTFLDEGKKAESVNPAPAVELNANPGFHVAAGKIAGGKVAAAANAAAESAPMRGLAKSSAAADSGCTAGALTITDTVKAPLKSTVNTISICFDAKALDSIKGNETVLKGKSVTTYNTGRVESAEISDADGDGILNPKSAAAKADIVFTVTEKGVQEKTVLVVGPGPDKDFDTEADNLVYASSWIKTAGSDTLGTAAYADADSDGVVIDNGKASVVDLDFYQKGPSADHPDAVWSRAQLRLVVRYQVEAKEAKRVRFEMENQAGRHEVGEILNAAGGKDFDMRDTIQAHFLSVGTAASDSIDTMDVVLAMTLGTDFDSKADDKVYAIDVKTVKKPGVAGEEKAAHFNFISDKPIPSGKEPEAGSLVMSVEYRDGTTLSVEGGISASGLDVTIKDREGKRTHVVWDREGRGISLEKLK
jgi:hypothetical protein